MDNRHLKVVASNQSIERKAAKEGKPQKETPSSSISSALTPMNHFMMGLFYLIWISAMTFSVVTVPMIFGFTAGVEWISADQMYALFGTAAVISMAGFFIFAIKKAGLNPNASFFQ